MVRDRNESLILFFFHFALWWAVLKCYKGKSLRIVRDYQEDLDFWLTTMVDDHNLRDKSLDVGKVNPITIFNKSYSILKCGLLTICTFSNGRHLKPF